MRWIATSLVLLLGAGFFTGAGRAAEPSFDKEIKPLLSKYCFKCHGPEKKKGDVDLSTFKDMAAVYHDPKLWEKVARQLHDHDMPPEGKPQPTPDEHERLSGWVRQTMASLDSLPKDPGRVVIRRLNRLEYNNTVRDLFAITNQPADKFPADGGGGGGFDNNADTLFVPPILMEKYLAAAKEVLDAAAPEKLFIAKPGGLATDRSAAKKIIEYHGARLWRRPMAKEDVERLLAAFDLATKDGTSFEDGVKLVLRGMLVSPRFLFRIENDRPSKEPYRVDDYELASRLSYFLWSSTPDDELYVMAQRKSLAEPNVLQMEVCRMLADPKARSFAESFVSQWLGTRKLNTSVQPDRKTYPSYTPELRDAMYQEPVEMFLSLLRNNNSVMDLLDANYTYVNAALAKHYGLPDVTGTEFRRISLPDHNRGGILGMGAVLTMTSYPLRTSPVLRGKWVLEEVLGTPAPPPPPSVPSLPTDEKLRDGLTFRQRLEAHRKNETCAACHKRMDPLGFGLENFDAIGRWRTQISGQPVDASGVMPTGEKFAGPAELKKILIQNKDTYLSNLTERLLSYSIGRGLEYYDMPVVKKITSDLARKDYRALDLVLEITKSYPFQYRRNQPVELSSK